MPLPPITELKELPVRVAALDPPARERTSTPETLVKEERIWEAVVRARVSVPTPPTMVSLPSRVLLAILKRSLSPPPTRAVWRVSAAVWVKVSLPCPPVTSVMPVFWALAPRVTEDWLVRLRFWMPVTFAKESFR